MTPSLHAFGKLLLIMSLYGMFMFTAGYHSNNNQGELSFYEVISCVAGPLLLGIILLLF